MAARTVRVKGLRDLQRDFRRLSKDLSKEVRDGLREAADPVRQEATRRFTADITDAFSSVESAVGYRVVVRQRGVAVEQSKRRTTGLRPDFGRLQMRKALEPALDSKQDQVVKGVEKVLDKLAGDNGF